jgi:hypothetical protein
VSFLAPLAVLFGLSLPALLLLYLLKVRRTVREVPSVFLWTAFQRDLAARDPWQRLRWSALLVIQLILLAVATLALVRPATVVPSPPSRFAALVVDTSASMRATDVAPNRFEQARGAARSVLDGAPEGTTFALIEAGATARVVVPETLDRTAVQQGLDGLAPTDSATDQSGQTGAATGDNSQSVTTALRIATALARGRADATIHLFSDGAYPHPPIWDELANPAATGNPDVNLRFHPVGTAVGNQAITALALSPDAGSAVAGIAAGGSSQLFARVQNFSSDPANLTVTLTADGNPVETRPVPLPAEGTRQLFFGNLPPQAKVIQLRIGQNGALAVDKLATLVRGDAPTVPVLLVTRGNLFLQKALQVIPGIALYQITPRSYPTIDPSAYAMVVFDGYAPDQPPTRNALLINPTDAPWLPSQGTVREPPITVWRSEDPTLAYVDLRTIRIARASNVTLPDWAHPLIESNSTPLGFVGSNAGQRIVGLTFDLQQSNFPLSASFPIFVANVVRFLTPATIAQAASLSPGEPALIRPPPGVDRVVVDGPASQQWTLTSLETVVRFEQTGQVGLYTAHEYSGSQVVGSQQFAVNLFSPAESDLRPRANLTDHDSAALPPAADRTQIIREYAPWLLALMLPLLVLEWWWFHRR